MPTPSTRTPVRIARGSYSNLNGSVSDLQDGEISYAEDQDKLYIKEGGSLVALTYTPASPAFTGTITGVNLTLSGNLTVNGTQTIINTQTLDVEDKQIEIGKVSSPSDTTADQGGWKLKGATDKTFLWVNATDAWTSSEHIHLGDNKQLLFGASSDLKIYHDQSSGQSIIEESGPSVFKIKASDFRISNTANSKDYIQANDGGAVKLFYNGGTAKVETTSSGINVTGAISVNGSPLSAAPEITATASGAIPANKIVVVNSNGTVSEGKETVSLLNPSTKGSEWTSHSTGANRKDMCFDKTNKQFFISRAFFSNVYYVRGEVDANGAFTQLSSGTVESNALDTCCIYDEEGEVIYFIYHDNASNGQTRMKLYNTANNTLSAESIVTSWWQSAGITDMCGVYEPKYKFVIFQGKAEGASNQLYIFTMYTDTTKTTKNNGGDGASGGSPSDDYLVNNDNGIAVDNDGHMVSIFTRNNNYPYYRIKTFTSGPALNGSVAGTWMTGTTRVNTTNTNCSRVQVAYEASADKFVLAWRENNGDIKARTGTITGSGSSISLSLGTELTIATGTQNGAVSLVADTSINAICIGYMDSNQRLSVNYLTISGTNLTKNSSALVVSSTAAYKYAEGAKGFPATFDTFRGRALFGWIDNNNRNINASVLNGTNSTNITTTNVIGTSGSAFSDTATATVQVAGNTNTGQSGLTAGLKYYVQRNGTLASTADPNLGTVEAGIALSSTKLLIKG